MKISGIDFAVHFSAMFDKEREAFNPPTGDVVIVYNIGEESAINTKYSAKVLSSLVRTLMAKGKWVILVSELSYTEFKTKYEIEAPNKISFPKEKLGGKLEL